MALLILKFGGKSVATIDCISNVARIVKTTRDSGHNVVAVVSAMVGETDRLINLANSFETINVEEYDALISTGEQVSASLLSMALSAIDCPAHSYNAAQLPIQTIGHHKKSRIVDINIEFLQVALENNEVPVVAGFQGINAFGRITTLGRGGSDLTAVALSAALNADECRIYTDVDGIYTSDPKVVPTAHRLDEITFEEMIEMSSLGAQVLQNRCLELAGKHQIPLRVLSSFESGKGKGTLISFKKILREQPLISGITLDYNQAKLTLEGIRERPEIASSILSAISAAEIEVDMIMQNSPTSQAHIDFSFTVHRSDYKASLSIIQEIASTLDVKAIKSSSNVSKISLVGLGIRSQSGIVSRMLKALGRAGIPIHMMSTSEIKISVIIDQRYVNLGARTLHATFDLEGVINRGGIN